VSPAGPLGTRVLKRLGVSLARQLALVPEMARLGIEPELAVLAAHGFSRYFRWLSVGAAISQRLVSLSDG
jgi:hypothetical protein